MSTLLKVLAFGFFCVGSNAYSQSAAPLASASTPASISLAISSAQAVYKSGVQIAIQVVLTNVSRSDIILGSGAKAEDQGELDFDVRVLNEKSARPSETKYGHKLRTGEDAPGESTVMVGSYMTFTVPPGKTFSEKIRDVGKLDNLTVPGKYTIQVERTDPVSHVKVKSNVIDITIEK